MHSLLTYLMLIKGRKFSATFMTCVRAAANIGKAENLFSAIYSTLKNNGVSWHNLVRFILDNTSSNMGPRNPIQ